jgi:hypothetical protein
LYTAEEEISQDSERNPATQRHSLSVKHHDRGTSQDSKKASDREALINCEMQREGQLELRKLSDEKALTLSRGQSRGTT